MPSSIPRRSARCASFMRAPLSGMFQVPCPRTGSSMPVAPNAFHLIVRVSKELELFVAGGIRQQAAAQMLEAREARVAQAAHRPEGLGSHATSDDVARGAVELG